MALGELSVRVYIYYGVKTPTSRLLQKTIFQGFDRTLSIQKQRNQ